MADYNVGEFYIFVFIYVFEDNVDHYLYLEK